jgi:hypothetical protein
VLYLANNKVAVTFDDIDAYGNFAGDAGFAYISAASSLSISDSTF